jgi:hypothetical protein
MVVKNRKSGVDQIVDSRNETNSQTSSTTTQCSSLAKQL